MEAARLARQRRRMIMYKKRMAKVHCTNIVSSKKFGGGSHRSKKLKDIAMIHDTDSCKRARLNRRMVLNLNRTRESSSNAQCLRRSTPSVINVFSHSVVGLNGDVATTTTLKEFGIHLPTNANALDKHLPTTELTDDGIYTMKKVLIQSTEQLELVREEICVSSLFSHPKLLPLLGHAIISVKENFRRESKRGGGGTFCDSMDVVQLKKLMAS